LGQDDDMAMRLGDLVEARTGHAQKVDVNADEGFVHDV